ncbi:hypothetical protein HA402_013042 [Bradysia odoriphaga]|nr:hypothetical protein HA402_013042 [Bradysia odoriphaga]
MCTLDLKICAEGEFLGTGESGCPECLQCPLKKIGCPGGVSPIKNPHQENKCPTWRCPPPRPVCTKEMKICKLGDYLGTGASGCPECLPCPQPRCARPIPIPTQQNQCPKWYCSTYPRPLPWITPAVE